MRRLTHKPWFGSKGRLGWGWRPVSPAGWAITAAFAGALIGSAAVFRGGVANGIVDGGLIILFGLTALLTGGRPGGPGR